MAELINEKDSLNTGRKKLNNAIVNADEAKQKSNQAVDVSEQAKQIAQTAENKADNVQEQFNQVVIEGDSSVEAAQARVDVEGKSFPTLKARLDEKETQFSSQLAQIVDQKLGEFHNIREFICDDREYVQGDGQHDDTTGIQRAFDTVRGAIFFPRGIYRITKPLKLNRNIDIVGFSRRDSVIRADGFKDDDDLLTVEITDNYGFGDVRGWTIKNINLFLNASGRHGLVLKEGLQILGGSIQNIAASGRRENGGYSLYIYRNFAHGEITRCQFGSIYLGFFDANLVYKNLFFGSGTAITVDIIYGVRNNSIRDNTIVNRDGALHLINGSNVRFINNQCEHMQGQGRNQSEFGAMIYVEGRDRQVENFVIEDNNFGGGTNYDRSIYIDNADKTIIAKNNFITVPIADVELTENAKNTFVRTDNYVKRLSTDTRPDTLMNIKVVDNGEGTIGYKKEASLTNLWKGNANFVKNEEGLISHLGEINNGVMTDNAIVLSLPKKFRPNIGQQVLVSTSNGMGQLTHTFNGRLQVKNLPSNRNLHLLQFPAADNIYADENYTVFDTFSNEFGTTDTDHDWVTVNNNIEAEGGEARLINNSPNDIAVIESNKANGFVQCEFSGVPTGFSRSVRLVFRYIDSQNYMFLTPNDTDGYQYGLYKVVQGAMTRIRGTTGVNFNEGDVARVVFNGEVIKVIINGVEIFETENNDFVTATKHGFELRQSTNGRIDNFAIK